MKAVTGWRSVAIRTRPELFTASLTLWSLHPHVPEDVKTRLAIAAAEVCADILEHTGDGQPGRSELMGDQVHVTFTVHPGSRV